MKESKYSKIEKVLKEAKEPLNISEISQRAKCNYVTTWNHINHMSWEKKIIENFIGGMRLITWKRTGK
jgi:hypothetical protein